LGSVLVDDESGLVVVGLGTMVGAGLGLELQHQGWISNPELYFLDFLISRLENSVSFFF
jgi:hypothetical protein